MRKYVYLWYSHSSGDNTKSVTRYFWAQAASTICEAEPFMLNQRYTAYIVAYKYSLVGWRDKQLYIRLGFNDFLDSYGCNYMLNVNLNPTIYVYHNIYGTIL